MTTDELERALTTALHASDDAAVDVERGLHRLTQRHEQRHQRRVGARSWVVAVAVVTTVLAVVLTTALALDGLRAADRRDVPSAPGGTLSPSGLPVGVLQAPVALYRTVFPGRLRLVVQADGTAKYSVFDGIDGGDETFDVTLLAAGPGRFEMHSEAAGCGASPAMVVSFHRRSDAVVLDRVNASGDCLVTPAIAAALTGLRVEVGPLPPS
jgi:hypothetical protein